MTREEKSQVIEALASELTSYTTIYLADISSLNAAATEKLRRTCFNAGIKLSVVKNTLLAKAMEQCDKDFQGLQDVLKGNTALMLFEGPANAPGKLIKDFRKTSDKPVLKGAWIDNNIFIGDSELNALATLKSREELIGEIIGLLQSPIQRVVSALQNQNKAEEGAEQAAE